MTASAPPSAWLTLPDGPPPAAGVITGRGELVIWRAGVPVLLAKVEQYAERAVTTPYGILVLGPRKAELVRPDGAQVLLAAVPDSKIALSSDGRHAAIAGVDLSDQPKFVLCLADLAGESVASVDCLAMPSVDALRDGVTYYRVRTGDQDRRAALAWTPGSAPVSAQSPARPGPQVAAALAASGGPYLATGTDGTPLTECGLHFGAQLAPGGRWLCGFEQHPPGVSVAEVSGDVLGEPRVWPIPRGCATAAGGNRRPVWEDGEHLLLVIPHDAVPGTRAIRVDVTTGAVERVNTTHCYDVEVFVEPWTPA
ncbi:MAG: hypothetical protein JOZ49_10870 [Mycolicibacterium sp.]|nr:hypothetical protein [Mycolicibacterium sp.]